MSGSRNRLTAATGAFVIVAASTSAPGAGPLSAQSAAEPGAGARWFALSMLYRGDATIVTAPCGATQDSAAGQAQPPPPPPLPPATSQPAVPPVGCPPPKSARRPGIYVGIAVAAAGGIGAAVALSGKHRADRPP